MSNIKVTPSAVRTFADNAKNWSRHFSSIESEMRNKVRSLGDSWGDSRFQQFVDILDLRSREMKLLAEQFEKIGEDMARMASRLDDEINEQQRTMQRYR